jgi:sugar O-acyltransferase (sialic acid O-acetyltransferase NeuD family)
MRVVIVGAGGHAQVVADILLRMRAAGEAIWPVGYVDDDEALAGQRFLDLPVLGTVADLAAVDHDAVVVAVGDNATRQRLFARLRGNGERFAVARHPGAVVAPDVPVGPGSMICAGAVVNPRSTIGADTILNTGCTVDHHNRVGDHAHVAPGVHLGGEVTIGEGAFVGIGSVVIPRRAIGAWATVGAGSVVTKGIPDGATAVGMPARVVRSVEGGQLPTGGGR